MAWSNATPVNDAAQDYAGWCLRMQQRTFPGSPAVYYNSARQAWDNAVQHAELPDGTAIVPIYYSWLGDLGDGQGRIDWGHAATFFPGRGILSSPGSGYGQKWFGSIDECARYFGATYLGWTEDVAGFRVVNHVPDPTPAPAPAPAPAPSNTIVVEPWPAQNSTLWGISESAYGDGSRWPDIYNANAGTIGGDPNLIQPGMVLVIP